LLATVPSKAEGPRDDGYKTLVTNARTRASSLPAIASGQTHDDCQWLDEEDGKEEVLRDGTCAQADELPCIERGIRLQRSERRQRRLQDSERDAYGKRCAGWTRFVGLGGRAAAVRRGLGDGATAILIVLVVWTTCALFTARATRLGAGLPAGTLYPTALGQREQAQDGGKPSVD